MREVQVGEELPAVVRQAEELLGAGGAGTADIPWRPRLWHCDWG